MRTTSSLGRNAACDRLVAMLAVSALCVFIGGCATLNTSANGEPEAGEVVEPAEGIGETDSIPAAEPGAVTGAGSSADRRGQLQLLVFSPRNVEHPPAGDVLEEMIAGHRETTRNLQERGLRCATLRSTDGWWYLFLDAPSVASIEHRIAGGPLFGNPLLRLSTSTWEFTVGSLCEGEQGSRSETQQLVTFTRDPAVLRSGGKLAPAPFGVELGELDEVTAAGSWGTGQIGYVILDTESANEARRLLASFPVAVDPQWSLEIRAVDLPDDTFCKK